MRLIDADALVKLDDDGFLDGIGRHELEEAETIDAVPVVRCTDCKYYQKKVYFGWCLHWIRALSGDDGFCSKGERKDKNE